METQLHTDPNEHDVDVDERTEKIEQEKQELLRKVLSGNLETKHDQVGFILNNNNAARNSDIELAWLYWSTFERDLFNGEYVTKNDLKKLTKIGSLTRSRARIQNEYKLFQADDKVKRYRGVLAAEMKEEAIDEKPEGLPMYSIYVDETGKTQSFLSVGSLWVIDGFVTFQANREIKAWVEQKGIDFEFHFTRVSRNRIDLYKEFFLKFLTLNPTVGFKIIVIDNSGIRDASSAITDLTFHLINKGINHENSTGRAPLPRLLQVWLDEEERGSDQLKIENLKERLLSQQIEGLYLGDFFAVDSKDNYNIQAVDLFTAAVNRKIHNPNSEGHVKDELANYILELLNFDVNNIDLKNSDTDKSTVFNLSFKD
ncbi:DUF3800 domain-containing protein [Marinifilum fragile]|uniref:DUF3800 domain-containing protein n=1 Tax=Marinifilum fragile TaxID=570161 RepID=UPI0006D1FA93|nr:DUF3800 domain-containing protein [Marinifilum fragile]